MYYLQSRYYDPVVCRFINADSYASTGQGILGYNMFAYCGNGPVDSFDSGGTKYEHVDIDDIAGFTPINGQETEPWNSIPFGLSNFGRSGCGVIACYNALVLYGKGKDILSVRDYFQGKLRARWFGVYPSEIGGYLDFVNVPYSEVTTAEGLVNSMTTGDIAIISFWNETYLTYGLNPPAKSVYTRKINIFEGAHTVAIKCIGDSFIVYNYSNKRDTPRNLTFGKIFDEGAFIHGYILK